MRKDLKKKNFNYMIIINSKIYRNLGGKIRKRSRRSSGFSDSDVDIIQIKFNPLFLYSADSEQEQRIFVNILDNYWDVQDMYVFDKHKIKKSSSYFKNKTAND